MAKRRRKVVKYKFNFSKFFAVIAVIVLVSMFSKNIIFMVANTNKFALASEGEISQTINTNGFILRDEYLVSAPASGTLSCNYRDGERIHVGSKIASIFTGNVDENLQIRLNKVIDRISEYQTNSVNMSYFTGNSQKSEAQILASINSIITANISGEISQMPALKDHIYTLVEKNIATERQKTLNALILERDELEQSVGMIRKDIYAPYSGVFISRLDGYENLFSVADRAKLLPTNLEKIRSEKNEPSKTVVQGSPVCKIIDNYTWYYATAIDTKITKNLKVGGIVKICFPSISQSSIKAEIDSINLEENGKSVVVFSCSENINTIYQARELSAEIISETLQGLKIQKSAIRLIDGITGVYVVSDNKAKFKEVEVLQTDEDFAVVREIVGDNSQLKLYDEVIIEGKNITEGKDVR
ncbi:hypothetical protein FACS189425_00060 [Clostridia bacterium]|nr:hypothetical protein FACS189425_00060 [Clostridia bacterium]